MITDTRLVGPAGFEVLPYDAPETEWLLLRNSGIGASEVAALLNHSKYQSPYSLWASKTGQLASKPRTQIQGLGLLMETPIAAMFAERHPEYEVRDVGLIRNTMFDHEIATPDRELLIDGEHAGLLEIKTANFGAVDDWGDEGTDDVPVAYALQCQWQCAVTGAPYVWLVALLGGDDYREYLITRDDDVIEYLRSLVLAFWVNHVLADVPPPTDGHEATTEALRQFPARDAVELATEALEHRKRYWAAKQREKDAEVEAAEHANWFRANMSGAEIGTVGDRRIVTNKYQMGRIGFDTKRFAEDHPDLYEQYVKRGASFPVLRVKEIREGEL